MPPDREQNGERDELEIELYDSAAPVSAAAGEVLEVTLEDAAEPPESAELPALSDLDALVAEPGTAWVDIPALCGHTGEGFVVRFRELKPGRYEFVGAEAKLSPSGGGEGRRPYQDVKGQFSLTSYPGCPVCGTLGLIECSYCQTVTCGGCLRERKPGLGSRCPVCHRDGQVVPGDAGVVLRGEGDIKKKKW